MEFYKYSGSGNDFIMLDNRDLSCRLTAAEIEAWCNRRYGIGADGVILIGASETLDFSMRIFNSDGSEAEMCGNGARCSIHFYSQVLHPQLCTDFSFQTMNGIYQGKILEEDRIQIKMTELYDVAKIDVSDLCGKNGLYLNTGVPHTVLQVSSVDDVNVEAVGAAIRYDSRFKEGTNICFFDVIQSEKQAVRLRVYERGVEGETLCCGTGVMATAVACAKFFSWSGDIKVIAKGGELSAIVDKEFEELYFCGRVKQVFKGQLLS